MNKSQFYVTITFKDIRVTKIMNDIHDSLRRFCIMKFDNAPIELVTKGKFNNGVYNEYIDNINPLDANIYTNKLTPKFVKNMALKEWHAYQFGDEKFFCLLVVMNMKKTAMIELIIYDIERKSFYKYLVTKPMPDLEIGKNLLSSTVFYKDESTVLEVSNMLSIKQITLNFSFVLKNGTSIKCNVRGDSSSTKPHIACIPLSEKRSMYTHKQALQMNGTLLINDELHRFKDNSFLIIDDQKSYYSRNFWWNWLTAVKVIDGDIYGFNLTENQSKNPKKYNENCMWYKNESYRLPPVKFLFDRKTMLWKIVDEKATVDLTFNVVFKNSINRNLMLVKSMYYAPFGWVSGSIKVDGLTLEVDKYFAMGEKIDIKL